MVALEWDGEYTHFRRLYQEIYQSTYNGKALMWVADLPGEEIVGQLFVQLDSSRNELANGKNRAYVYGFRVKPAYQCAGIGTKLLTVVENDLLQRNYEWITLNVGRNNLDARRFYDRLGYYVMAADPGQWTYYDDQGKKNQVNEPAWRMLKRLG
jgi:ribosomal protein S18 acetylase RimI-like enzyme